MITYQRISFDWNLIGDVMVSVLASNVVDDGFGYRSGKTKEYKAGFCCFSAKYAALKRNEDNVYPRTVVSVS